MSQQQRDTIDALLRASQGEPGRSIQRQRASFTARYAERTLGEDINAGVGVLGTRPSVELELDGARSTGVILYLHGGSYVVGSAETGAHLAAQLVRRTGTRAVSLDYRLAPEHPFPAAIVDAVAAYRDLLDRGIPAQQIAVAGDSSGGGLGIAALLSARDAGLPAPAAAVVFSPWVDLSLAGASMTGRALSDPLFSRERMQPFAEHYLGAHDPRTELASPVFADLSGLPPLLIQVGSHEVLLDDAVRLAAGAAQCDVDVTLAVTAGVPHVFQNFAGSLDEADAALDQAGSFLARQLSAAVPA
jgi:acetyl esterase/lipase